MLESQNGYPVPVTLAEQAATLTDVTVVGGVLRLRKGDVACVEQYLFDQLALLEVPMWPGCWSFYVRPIRGETTGYSNHGSGSAFDFSAPKHPRQSFDRYDGWTAAHVAAIHRLLSELDGVIRWGGDYHSEPYDPMHFEINASPAAVAKVAAKIRAGQMPGQKGSTVSTVAVAFAQPQNITGPGWHLLRVTKDGGLSVLGGACAADGVVVVEGTGAPGTQLLVEAVNYRPSGKTYVAAAGGGQQNILVRPDGTFRWVYPVRLDVPALQHLRVRAAVEQPATFTSVAVDVRKEAA